MRGALAVEVAAVGALLAGAGCRPDIAFGAYTCGPEASCPTDQKCDEVMDVCVDPPTAAAFACTGSDDHEPDNTVADATVIGPFTCASSPTAYASCLDPGDALDLFALTTPATCASVGIQATLSYPLAYEGLKLTLAGSDGTTVIATATPCSSGGPADDGVLATCLAAPLADATTYILRVEPTGSGDCAGACAFNRYQLTVELTQ